MNIVRTSFLCKRSASYSTISQRVVQKQDVTIAGSNEIAYKHSCVRIAFDEWCMHGKPKMGLIFDKNEENATSFQACSTLLQAA